VPLEKQAKTGRRKEEDNGTHIVIEFIQRRENHHPEQGGKIMAIDLGWIIYLALAFYLVLGGICFVVGYFLLRPLVRDLRARIAVSRGKRTRRPREKRIQVSFEPGKA